MPALRRQRQVDPCEFEASLVYRASSRAVGAVQRNPVLKTKTKTKTKTKAKTNQKHFSFSFHTMSISGVSLWLLSKLVSVACDQTVLATGLRCRRAKLGL